MSKIAKIELQPEVASNVDECGYGQLHGRETPVVHIVAFEEVGEFGEECVTGVQQAYPAVLIREGYKARQGSRE